jgi:NADH dehydrogenase
MTIQSILVIGGSGMLGIPVVRRLLADGYCARVLTRSLEATRQKLGPGSEIVPGDVEDLPSLARALAGCQAVHINLSGGTDPDLERRGAESAAFAASKAGLERITYLSGASVREENIWFADTRARFYAEAAVRQCGVPYTIFKAHFFMESLLRFIRGPFALQIGSNPHPYPWIAAADYAQMVSRSFSLPEAAGKELFIYGPQELTMRQALQTYCRIVRPDLRLVYFPLWAAAIFARLGRRRELQAALPFFHYMEIVQARGDPAEANALLGAPTTTLEAWCQSLVS